MSTLHVENLKGLSSGGNANKIIIPSGQTIDASAGTLKPSAGQIVQYQERYYDLSTFTTSSASSVDVTNYYVDITPTKATNKIRVQFGVHCMTTERTGYARFRVVNSNNSDTRMNVNAYTQASGYQVDTDPWLSENIVATFVAGTTSTMRLQLQVLRGGSGDIQFGWSSSDSRHAEAWEIEV